MECAARYSGRPVYRRDRKELPHSVPPVAAQFSSPSFHPRSTLTSSVSSSAAHQQSLLRNGNNLRYGEAWREASDLTKSRCFTDTGILSTYRRPNRLRFDDPTSGTVVDVVRSSSDESQSRFAQRQSTSSRNEEFTQPTTSCSSYRHRSNLSRSNYADHTSSESGGMKIDYGLNVVDNELKTMSSGGRRSSQDLGSYIDKYQKSDHHVDRLVRTVVQYEAATGQQFPDRTLLPSGVYLKPKTTAYISALPEVVYVKTAQSSAANDGPVYANSQGQLRRLSVDRGSSATRSSAAAVSSLSVQLQPAAYHTTTGRPPRSSSYLSAPDQGVPGLRAASLPPPSPISSLDPLSAYRRRPSVSSTAGTYRSRAGSIQGTGYTGLPPRASGSPSDLSGTLTTTARRSSYSGLTKTTDPVGLSLSRRSSVTSSIAGGYPGSRGTSVERSTNGGMSSTYSLPTPPPTPNMSDTRRHIRRVLYKVSGDEDYRE